MTERIPGTLSADTFLAEYQELRSFGITHQAAATRLGVNVRTLERRFERAGYQWREKVA